MSISDPHFVCQISQPPNIGQKWFCILNLHMDLSFQEKKTACKSVTWFSIYGNYRNTGEFRRFFFKHPVCNHGGTATETKTTQASEANF